MTTTRRHMHITIREALKYPETFRNCITVDGKLLTNTKAVKKFFEEELAQGHELMPCADCEGFDWKKGCPGHRVEEDTQ